MTYDIGVHHLQGVQVRVEGLAHKDGVGGKQGAQGRLHIAQPATQPSISCTVSYPSLNPTWNRSIKQKPVWGKQDAIQQQTSKRNFKKNLLQGMWWLIDGAPHCCPAVSGLNPASPNKRAYYQSIIGLSHANQFKKDFRFYKKRGGSLLWWQKSRP
jgi:hypothetical protein